MKSIVFAIVCFFAISTNAQDQVPFPFSDTEAQKTVSPTLPEDLKGLVWNKWQTKSFIIISIDKNQGLYLKNNLEEIKENLFASWGINNIDFKGNCKIVCVSDKKLLKRIFRLDSPKFEINKNQNGDLSYALWFSLDDTKELPIFELMQLCVAQLDNYKIDLPLFCKRGICILSDSKNVKSKILSTQLEKISFEDVFSKNEANIKEEELSSFDIKSCIICLLMRKEYGQENFVNYLKTKNLNEFGIKSTEKFDEIINRYYRNLLDDLKNNKTPEDYLIIRNRR